MLRPFAVDYLGLQDKSRWSCVLFQVEEADQVFLLMKEEYRISRNVRLAWFLSKLNQVIRPTPKAELVGDPGLLSAGGNVAASQCLNA